MTTIPDEPQDADPTQLEHAEDAIDDAKAAAGRVASDESIDTGSDLPSEEQNVPGVPAEDESEDDQTSGSDEDSHEDQDGEQDEEQDGEQDDERVIGTA